jgi:HEAT repeat protein
MSAPEATPAEPRQRLPTGPLPPVTPPTATFILQLFLIPLLIVTIVVVLWLLFSWVAHMGRDNAGDLAKAIIRNDAASWQRAYELADLLRSPDPKYAALRQDAALAKSLADFLDRDLNEPLLSRDVQATATSHSGSYSGNQAPPGSEQRARVMRRMYLCRSLGSFAVQEGLPVLLRAAQQEIDPVEVQVRFAAIEAISTLADNCGPHVLQANSEVIDGLLAASRVPDDSSSPPPPADGGEISLYRPHAELRAVAAYALGVVGGDQAQERLELMLHDTYPNARYNAATGLARSGNEKCIAVLREMLDPTNTLAVKDEVNPNDQARKRTTVLLNGIKATLHLANAKGPVDLSPLVAALERLVNSPLDTVTVERSKVKAAATEALRLIQKH